MYVLRILRHNIVIQEHRRLSVETLANDVVELDHFLLSPGVTFEIEREE